MKRIELQQGQKFGRLTIIKESEPFVYPSRKTRAYECKCECGSIKTYQVAQLRCGMIVSCGCYGLEQRVISTKISNSIHNDTRKKGSLYHTWQGIKSRCYNQNAVAYHRYGGRGIKMYDSWINSYQSFKEWIINNLGERPDKHTIDRIDNNVGYFPDNLKWSSAMEQANNRRKPNVNGKRSRAIHYKQLLSIVKDSQDYHQES